MNANGLLCSLIIAECPSGQLLQSQHGRCSLVVDQIRVVALQLTADVGFDYHIVGQVHGQEPVLVGLFLLSAHFGVGFDEKVVGGLCV